MSKSHLFQPGVSGNPKGKPPGAGPGVQLRNAILKRAPEIVEKLIESALDGDSGAAKVLLDRVCPVLKPQATPINLPIGGTLSEQGGEVIRATMDGTIPPDVGAMLISALSQQTNLIELDSLLARIDALEAKK